MQVAALVVCLFAAILAAAAPKKVSKRAAVDAGVASADAGTPEPFVWDIPDIIEVVDVQGELSSSGIPMRASAVRTRATGEPLVMHVFESFKRAGLFVPVPATMTQIDTMPQVTGFDTERHVSYTAMFQVNPDQTTTVILTEADLGHRQQPKQNGVPIFPGASGVVRSTLEGSEVITYSTSAQPTEVEAFYAGYAQDAGMSSANDEAGVWRVILQGRSGTLSVDLSGSDAGTRVTLIDRPQAGADQNEQGELK